MVGRRYIFGELERLASGECFIKGKSVINVKNKLKQKIGLFFETMLANASCALLTVSLASAVQAQPITKVDINHQLWNSFTKTEQASLLEKFPNIEIVPSESVGIVQSVQSVNRSAPGTSSGALLGATVGQAMYIDHAFRGSGGNYSAITQVGAALLGAALGSNFDSAPTSRFVFNYAIKTLDGQIREVRVESSDEFTRPIGQCVMLPSVTPTETSLCGTDKVQLLKKLSAIGQAPVDALISNESSGLSVKCRIPGVGLMTLEKNVCIQMDGGLEK